MMKDEVILRERLAGSFNAIVTTLSILIEQSPSRTLICDRLTLLADHLEKEVKPDLFEHNLATIENLRTIVALTNADQPKPTWKPEVISGGREDDPTPE